MILERQCKYVVHTNYKLFKLYYVYLYCIFNIIIRTNFYVGVQVLNNKSDPGDYNDNAVYMESQAFLMHEIMTDGMAFCSVM